MRGIPLKLSATLLVAVMCSVSAVMSEARDREAGDTPKMTLNAKPAYSVLKAGEKQLAWMRVGLTGFHREKESQRPPMP